MKWANQFVIFSLKENKMTSFKRPCLEICENRSFPQTLFYSSLFFSPLRFTHLSKHIIEWRWRCSGEIPKAQLHCSPFGDSSTKLHPQSWTRIVLQSLTLIPPIWNQSVYSCSAQFSPTSSKSWISASSSSASGITLRRYNSSRTTPTPSAPSSVTRTAAPTPSSSTRYPSSRSSPVSVLEWIGLTWTSVERRGFGWQIHLMCWLMRLLIWRSVWFWPCWGGSVSVTGMWEAGSGRRGTTSWPLR